MTSSDGWKVISAVSRGRCQAMPQSIALGVVDLIEEGLDNNSVVPLIWERCL